MASDGDDRVTINKTFFEDKTEDGTTKCKEEYSRREIQEFLEANSKGDDVLEPIVEMMKSLNPKMDDSLWDEGSEYSILKPDQIIYRKGPTKDSKKKIPTLGEDKRFTTQHHNPDNHKPYWNFWSLLGLFLSLKYKADPMSTPKDFFARLTIMYAWWCRELIPGGKSSYPKVSQCTWGRAEKEKTDDTFDLFLGHSFGGAKGDSDWKTRVKQGRYELLDAIVMKDEGRRWCFDRSPMINLLKDVGTRFGNCAETYPFLSLVENPNKPEGYLTNGYALKYEYFGYKNESERDNLKKYCPDKAKDNYMPPCDNCTELLRLCGVEGPEKLKRYTSEGKWDNGAVKDKEGEGVVIGYS